MAFRESRTRHKLISTQHLRGKAWDAIVSLGSFRNREVGAASWNANTFNEVTYIPDNSLSYGQITVDELHRKSEGTQSAWGFASHQRGGYFYREGGPFLSIRVDTGIPIGGVTAPGVYANADNLQRYEGGFMTPPNSPDWWGEGWAIAPLAFLSKTSSLLPDLTAWVDKAWHAAKPKIEHAGAYVFLREARDIPRMLRTTSKALSDSWEETLANAGVSRLNRTLGFSPGVGSRNQSWIMSPKRAADQFLNDQFGWRPFLNDLHGFDRVYQKSTRYSDRISKFNGRWEHRRVNLVDENHTTVLKTEGGILNGTSYPLPCWPAAFPAQYFAAAPTWRLLETVRNRVYVSGKFRYYRPEFDASLPDHSSAWNSVMRYAALYGLRVSPSNIYKAIPWTWAIDWVSNMGDHLERLSDIWLDSMVAEYLYLMQTYSVSRMIEVVLPFHAGTKTLLFERKFEVKRRVEADSPYGFSLSVGGLTPRQLAIIGALGLSRRFDLAH